jgi:hypothetical protein
MTNVGAHIALVHGACWGSALHQHICLACVLLSSSWSYFVTNSGLIHDLNAIIIPVLATGECVRLHIIQDLCNHSQARRSQPMITSRMKASRIESLG